MAVPQPDYMYYSTTWGGDLPEAAFNASLRHATAAVADVIGFNDAASSDAAKRAVCAAVDVDAAWGGEGGAASGGSVSVGSFSASSGTGDGGYDADMRRAIRAQLVGTGLLYQGV
jgi:hypothetical protein